MPICSRGSSESRCLGVIAATNAKDNTGGTPLHASAFAGHKDVAELLLANKANVNAKNDGGGTPLQQGPRLIARRRWRNYCSPRGANVNAKDNIGQTPLLDLSDLRPLAKPEQPASWRAFYQAAGPLNFEVRAQNFLKRSPLCLPISPLLLFSAPLIRRRASRWSRSSGVMKPC